MWASIVEGLGALFKFIFCIDTNASDKKMLDSAMELNTLQRTSYDDVLLKVKELAKEFEEQRDAMEERWTRCEKEHAETKQKLFNMEYRIRELEHELKRKG